MDRLIEPARRIHGAVRVPGDKSVSHRALILAALSEGESEVAGLAPGLDVQSTAGALRALGVSIEAAGEVPDWRESSGLGLTVVRPPPALRAPSAPIDCGNSGTTIRLLAGVLAGCPFEAELTGDASLRRRPMKRVAEPLRRMGARVEATRGSSTSTSTSTEVAPLRIRGTVSLRGIVHEMPIASAQVKSAVLLAGLRAAGETVVLEPSRSRDHTERMLRSFGVDVLDEGLRVAVRGPAELEGTHLEVPADLSSAAFFACAAAALARSKVILRDVLVNPTRTGALDVLRAMGARVHVANEREIGFEPVADLMIEPPANGAPLRATAIGGRELIPRLVDELPALAVLATQAEGVTVIRDAEELRVKESDRIAVTARNLAAMGARVEATPDGLRIEGPTPLRGGARIATEGDHRMAMAFAVAALLVRGSGTGEATTIEDAACAAVSFPGFFERLEELVER